MYKRYTLTLTFLLMATLSSFAELKANAKKFRDPAMEDSVARLFDDARRQAGAKPLARIKYREEVQAVVCTATMSNNAPISSKAAILYKTSNPSEMNSA